MTKKKSKKIKPFEIIDMTNTQWQQLLKDLNAEIDEEERRLKPQPDQIFKEILFDRKSRKNKRPPKANHNKKNNKSNKKTRRVVGKEK